MNVAVFNAILKDFTERRKEAIIFGDEEPSGLFIEYQNANGEYKEFAFCNIKPSEEYGEGYVEGDCISGSRYQYNQENFGIDDINCAVSSHRTLRIDRIISAHII